MKPLLLLHGAIGSQDQFNALKEVLGKTYTIYTLNFSGHGGKAFVEEFSIPQFAQEVLDWLNEKQINSISIFGYSMGGYVAFYLAIHHPRVVQSIVTLGTKFHWDEAIAAKEATMLDAAVIIEKLPKFAATLEKQHAPIDWKELLAKTANMLKEMGKHNPFFLHQVKEIKCPVLVMIGDKDNMVSLVETATVYKELQQGQLAVLPATPHPLDKVDISLLASMIRKLV